MLATTGATTSDTGRNVASSSMIAQETGSDVSSDASSQVGHWGDTLDLDSRILKEIGRFVREKAEFESGYPQRLATSVRRLIFESAVSRLDEVAAGLCTTFVDVTYEDAGFAGEDPDSDPEREFEEGFIRIEVLACLHADDVGPEAALRAYTAPEFRKKVSSRVKRIWREGGESCVETKGMRPFLSSTLACNRVDELHTNELAAQHSQVVLNPEADKHQEVYFKESLKTFIRVPGGLVMHYVNYTRTVRLGGLRKRIGRGKVIDSQERAIRELRAVLTGAGDPE